MADALLTPDQAAELLGVPRSRVLALVRGRAIEVVDLGPRTKRIRPEALDRYLAGRTIVSDGESNEAGQRVRQRLPH